LLADYQAFWDAESVFEAREAFRAWFWWATHSRLEPFRKLVWKMRGHLDNIISYFKLSIKNGIVEGFNNKAKVVMRQSFGFRTPDLCKLVLMHCLGGLELPSI